MEYALIYSYENHNYELVEKNQSLREAKVERLYEFSQNELGTARKILHNLSQLKAA